MGRGRVEFGLLRWRSRRPGRHDRRVIADAATRRADGAGGSCRDAAHAGNAVRPKLSRRRGLRLQRRPRCADRYRDNSGEGIHMAHRAASPVTRARSNAAAPARRIRTDAVAADVLELLALGDDPDLDLVLQRILQAARRLVAARYAALGVPDGRGGFARFVTSGISEKRAAQIGELPRTHGVLGVLLEEGPILLADIRKHPRFGYYPQHHPEMTDFLGVPITHRGEVLGNLFASGHRSARFSKQDQRALETLAAYAGVAIANADLYTRAQQLAVIEERNRVVRELHDAATQSLFSLVFAAR